ncbi:MAG: tol-pal system YbgF family protein [Phycisphaerae bacterium]
MKPNSAQDLLGVFFTFLLTAGFTWADAVVLKGRPPFRNVRIIDFKHGRLVFRGVSKEVLRKPLNEVARFKIDRSPILTGAEALAQTNAQESPAAYRRALTKAADPWLRDLIRVRLLEACDRAGRFDEAVALYTELLRGQTVPANSPAPRHPGAVGWATNQEPRRHWLAENEPHPWRLLLGRCRIALGQFARAADELLALAESAPSRGLSADALYYVGVAHERMERADVAAELYRELLRREDLPADLRRLAERGLQRLGE